MRLLPFSVAVATALAIVTNAWGAGFQGDFNINGYVDEADYVHWRKNIQSPMSFDLWRANFGQPDMSVGPGVGSGGPTVQLVPGGAFASGHLNANGDWVSKVQITPSNPIPTGVTALAATLGFKETASSLIDANGLSTVQGDDFDTAIPGTSIFGWENLQDTDPGPGVNMWPVGLQSNCAGGLCTENTPANIPNTAFAALGSQLYSTSGPKDFIELIVRGPCVDDHGSGSCSGTGDRLSTTIEWFGSQDGDGRIAELSPSGMSVNYEHYSGSVTRTARAGDANLDGAVDLTDRNIWIQNVGIPSPTWYSGDFNDDNIVNAHDYAIWAMAFGDLNNDGSMDAADYALWRKTDGGQDAYGMWRLNFGTILPGGGSGWPPDFGVPEPGSRSMVAVGLLGMWTRRRKG
jgi:hypothetical protein